MVGSYRTYRSFPARTFAVCSLLSMGLAACGGDGGPAGPAEVSTVEISPVADTLRAIDATRQLTATAFDAQGNPVSVDGFDWASTDPAVVTVDENGVVTATGNGIADVRASVGSTSGLGEVVVFQEVSGVTITPSAAGLTELETIQQFEAEATDRNANPVADVDFLWISSDPSVAVVDTAGRATAKGTGQTTITAAARGVPANAVLSVTPDAAQLAFVVEPSDVTAGAAISPGVQVEIRDSGGNLLEDARTHVTLTLDDATGAAELEGTPTVGATGGVANFPGLEVKRAGSGYSLVASAAGLPDATSSPFSVSPADPVQLGFVTLPPGQESAGVPLGVQVAVQDEFGNTVPVSSPAVGLEVATGPEAGALVGDRQADPVDGVVDFSALSIERAGVDYSLDAVAGGLMSAVTDSFTVVPAAPDTIRFRDDQFVVEAGAALPDFEIEVVDEFENVVDTFSRNVSIELDPVVWPGAALDGAGTVAAVEGVATFSGVVPTKPGQPYGVVASTPALGPQASIDLIAWLPDIQRLSAGGSHTCIGAFGRSFCWGSNQDAQLGAPTGAPAGDSVAIAVEGPAAMTEIGSGGRHTCGIEIGGAAHCWGANDQGQLGDGNQGVAQPLPVPVSGAVSFSRISAGASHTCAVSAAGDAYCWGDNTHGQLGTGSPGGSSDIPVQVSGGLTFVDISAGGRHTCALGTDDSVYCWGDNEFGQLGDDNAPTDSGTPVTVTSGESFAFVQVGDLHSCGVVELGPGQTNVRCWGSNSVGQLGDDNGGVDSDVPVTVQGTGGFLLDVNGFQILQEPQLAVGSDFACAIIDEVAAPTELAEIACWGSNASGQLGNGESGTSTDLAVGVTNSSGFSWDHVSAGGSHACADASGAVAGQRAGTYCWGSNDSGQLGDGSTSSSSIPVFMVQ